jgi:hypothetical protein
MEQQDISHKEIYDRLLVVEQAVASLSSNTSEMLSAFNAAKGAFTALEWIGKVIKPLIVIGTFLAAIAAYWSHR